MSDIMIFTNLAHSLALRNLELEFRNQELEIRNHVSGIRN
jgi:hypothetical protein